MYTREELRKINDGVYSEKEIGVVFNFLKDKNYIDASFALGSTLPYQFIIKRNGEDLIEDPKSIHLEYIGIVKDSGSTETIDNQEPEDPSITNSEIYAKLKEMNSSLDMIYAAVQSGHLLDVKNDEKLFELVLKKLNINDRDLDGELNQAFSNRLTQEDKLLVKVLLERQVMRQIYGFDQKTSFVKSLWKLIVGYTIFETLKVNLQESFPEYFQILMGLIDSMPT